MTPPRLSESSSVFLDLLRAVLAQLVLVGHAASQFGVITFLHPPNFPWIQSFAVVGFFWLSGFLICHSVLTRKARGNYRFASYFVDRFARIYSGYLPAFAVVIVADLIFLSINEEAYRYARNFDVPAALQNLFMLQKFPVGLISSPIFGSGATWWTLGIEWWLYMFFGFLLLVFLPRPDGWKRIAGLVLLSIVPIGYTIDGTGHVGHGLSLMWLMATVLTLFLATSVNRFSPGVAGMLALMLTLMCAARLKISGDAYDMIAAILFGLAMFAATVRFQNTDAPFLIRLGRPVRLIAGYSFTLFLTHYSILLVVDQVIPGGGWSPFLTTLLASNLIASLVALPTEMRHKTFARWLKGRFLKQDSPPPDPATGN